MTAKKRWLVIPWCFFGLAIAVTAFGADAKKAKVPDEEKRSMIQSVDGYAQLSEDMTLANTRAAAFTSAKRQAVEMARTYIESKTTVEDFMLKEDVVKGSAQGAVTVLESKDMGVENNARYHIWIKAEVEYGLKPPLPEVTAQPATEVRPKAKNKNTKIAKAAPSSTSSTNVAVEKRVLDENGPLTVRVWTPKKKYTDGEKIKVHIQGNRDFYARIVDITSNGDIIQLLPNDYRQKSFFKKGVLYTVPGKGDRFELEVSPPYGQDRIVVYASEMPLGKVDTTPAGQGLRSYRGTRKDLGIQTRGISVVGKDRPVSTPVEFYEAGWTLNTAK